MVRTFFSLLVIAASLGAQTPRPVFEVASIKPSDALPRTGGAIEFHPGGRFVARNMPVAMLISAAYNVPFQSPQLTGPKDWLASVPGRFDIEASAEKGAIPTGMPTGARELKMKLMLQSLLEDRFKLHIRREPREQPIYTLNIGKGGPKLEKSKVPEKTAISGGQGRGIHGAGLEIADVVLYVQNWTDRPLVDKTGLTGLYNIQTDGWTPMNQRPVGPDGVPVGEAGLYDPDRQTLFKVFEQLGLKMEATRGTIDMYIVEHIEKPIEN